MERPTFDRFHPNADESNNACEAAEKGDFAKACVWLNEAQNGLEYAEAAKDYGNATSYVQHKAEEAGVTLVGPTATALHTDWQVDGD